MLQTRLENRKNSNADRMISRTAVNVQQIGRSPLQIRRFRKLQWNNSIMRKHQYQVGDESANISMSHKLDTVGDSSASLNKSMVSPKTRASIQRAMPVKSVQRSAENNISIGKKDISIGRSEISEPARIIEKKSSDIQSKETFLGAKPLQRSIEISRATVEDEDSTVSPKMILRQENEEEIVSPTVISRQSDEEEMVSPKMIFRQENEEETISPKIIQRQSDEEETVSRKIISRQSEEEEIQGKGLSGDGIFSMFGDASFGELLSGKQIQAASLPGNSFYKPTMILRQNDEEEIQGKSQNGSDSNDTFGTTNNNMISGEIAGIGHGIVSPKMIFREVSDEEVQEKPQNSVMKSDIFRGSEYNSLQVGGSLSRGSWGQSPYNANNGFQTE